MKLSEKNLREKRFHNELQSKPKGRFENTFYRALSNTWDDFFSYLEKNAKNSEILDYGCGIGPSIKRVATFGPKKITGIDISEVSINKAKHEIANIDLNIELKVDNCEKTNFDNNQFDIVYGLGILHHLDFTKCISEISRVLKPGGSLIFVEPLGTNPLINFYRKLTPNSRSKDEHPLIERDFYLLREKFNDVETKYYGLLTLVFFPFYINPKKSTLFKIIKKVDQFLFKIKFFRILAWSVLIIAKKP